MKKKLIVLCIIGIVALTIAYYFRQNIYTYYIFEKVGQLEVIQDYTAGTYENMKIVGEEWGKDNQWMQIDGYVGEDRKKIAVQYNCDISCSISSIGIYNADQRKIIYGNNDTSWIEDWGSHSQ